MLNETLRSIRKSKGFTQEELAARLNVVRQTVSKWEKGLSVPDADILIKIAELFEVSVSELLGANIRSGTDQNTVAEQLSRINEQLAIRNMRSNRIWKTIGIILLVFLASTIFLILINMVSFSSEYSSDTPVSTESMIVEQD